MMGIKTFFFAFTLASISSAFVPATFVGRQVVTEINAEISRRSLFENTALVGAGLILTNANSAALASGGATAGGAYLLSAKQRYNDRVKAAMKGFVGLRKSLEGGSIDEMKEYFSTEDVGGWKDGSAAGYLLANAFRRNSSAAPDSLPSVKAWKAFAKEVEGVMKSAKKKDATKTLAALDKALPVLEEYLTLVELPAAAEL
mmetsp:Transcript_21459/g.35537  ORF Transcript_21459/g.35537 Transcript_21459/m.35537 type:complete len:201 (+) Transcript_21459:44-646(+)